MKVAFYKCGRRIFVRAEEVTVGELKRMEEVLRGMGFRFDDERLVWYKDCDDPDLEIVRAEDALKFEVEPSFAFRSSSES